MSRFRTSAKILPPLLMLCLGALLTTTTCWLVAQSQDELMRDAFLRDAEKLTYNIDMRLRTHFDMLLSIRGLYASSTEVDRREFAAFVRELDLAHRHPGYQAVQYVRVVPDRELGSFVQRVRNDRSLDPKGYPEFDVRPDSTQDPHYVIEFTEPLAGNEAAFGFDLASNPIHRDALSLGRDTGQVVATAPVRLRQELGNQAGFIARLPIYRAGARTDSVEARRAALQGFAAIVFRVDNLMQEIIDKSLLPHLVLTIEDVGYIDDEQAGLPRSAKPLYDSRTAHPDLAPEGKNLPLLQHVVSLDVGHRRWELRFAGADGSRYGRRTSLLGMIAAGGVLITLLSVTLLVAFRRRRMLADQLREALGEQRAFLDNAVVGIALWTNGQVQRTNRGIEEMFGYDPGELIGTSGAQLFVDDAHFRQAQSRVNEVLFRGERYQDEWQLVRKDGSLLWCATHAQLVDRKRPQAGVVWVMHDITDRKNAEAALVRANEELEHSLTEVEQQKTAVQGAHDELADALAQLRKAQANLIFSEKMASLGAMVAGIAHELNTPIGNSLLAASALSDRVSEFEQLAQAGRLKRSALETHLADTRVACALLTGSLQKAANLIASFKQVAVDQTSDERREFDLAQVLADTLATFAVQMRRGHCESSLDAPEGILLDSYPGSLGQVISNLIMNTLLHAFGGREGGRLHVSARELDEHNVEILFDDDGVGMNAEVVRRIFDPFFTTKMGQGGSGLGMNIVYNIVTRMLGGSIDVDSTPGSGTRVRIRLPKSAPHRDLPVEDF